MTSTSNGGDGEGVGGSCRLTGLNRVGSGGWAGGEGGTTKAGRGSQGAWCVHSCCCNGGDVSRREGVGVAAA